MNIQQPDLLTLAHSRDGRPLVISFETAMELRKQGRAFVHKPSSLQKMQKPVDNDDDFGPEAA